MNLMNLLSVQLNQRMFQTGRSNYTITIDAESICPSILSNYIIIIHPTVILRKKKFSLLLFMYNQAFTPFQMNCLNLVPRFEV